MAGIVLVRKWHRSQVGQIGQNLGTTTTEAFTLGLVLRQLVASPAAITHKTAHIILQYKHDTISAPSYIFLLRHISTPNPNLNRPHPHFGPDL